LKYLESLGVILASGLFIVGWTAAFCAWVTHVLVCIKAGAWVLLAFGCVIFPIGIIHGFGVWFGYFN